MTHKEDPAQGTVLPNILQRALDVWSTDKYRSVMLPGIGAKTCGVLADAIRSALASPPAPAAGELRLCGYCKTWNSKPCGEQCCWQPTDPVHSPADFSPEDIGSDGPGYPDDTEHLASRSPAGGGFDPNKKYTNHLSVLVDAVGGEGMQRVKAALDIAGYTICKGDPTETGWALLRAQEENRRLATLVEGANKKVQLLAGRIQNAHTLLQNDEDHKAMVLLAETWLEHWRSLSSTEQSHG